MEELKIFNKEIDIIITGNKSDLGKYDIDKEYVCDYCHINQIDNFFTSAKTGDGLDELFNNIFLKLAKRFYKEGSSKKRGITIVENNSEKEKEKNCC